MRSALPCSPQHLQHLLFADFLKYKFIYFNWRLITLQYCIGFAIHQQESATGVHLFPILNTPSHLPPNTIPLGHPSAPAPSIQYCASNLDWRFFHIWYYTSFNAILPNHPTLSQSHRVQKTILYICVSFALSDRGWDCWMASLTKWTWVWMNSRSWWWTGRPGVLDSWGRKESDMTEQLNWTELIMVLCL